MTAPTPEDRKTAMAIFGLFPGSKVGIGQARLLDRMAMALATERDRGYTAGLAAAHEQRA